MNRTFSRRTMLGTGAAASAVAIAGPTLANSASAGPMAAPAHVRKLSQSSGATLKLAIQAFAHDALKPVLDDWSAATGNTVELESGPVSGQEMITKYAPAFQSETSPVDIISDADDSSPTFMRAGWIEPLDGVIPDTTWADFPESFTQQIETWHSYDGVRYRIPHEFAIGYTFYRKDWFDEKSVAPPTSWDEVVSV
jgi:multiple sugar transport system substrate-binding protein